MTYVNRAGKAGPKLWLNGKNKNVMYQRLLVPTDGTEQSQRAAQVAVELAARIGAAIVAINVVARYPVAYFEGGVMSMSAQDAGRAQAEWVERGQAVADQVRRVAEQAGVAATAVTAVSELVAEAILAAARKHGCDLVVMASHGRKGIHRLLLGSETQHVLTHGNIPVLVVR